MYNFWCEHRINCKECNFCDSKGNVSIATDETDLDHYECQSNFNEEKIYLKLMGEITNVHVGELLKHRPKQEARQRATSHFQKEILPTLGKTEKKHFAKQGIKAK